MNKKVLKSFIGENNLKKIYELDLKMQEKVFKFYELCYQNNIKFDIVSGLRTYEEQKELYDKYAHIYGNDKISLPGTSEHENGMAIDITIDNNLSNNEKYTKAGSLWQQLGGSWGGHTIDEYWHFELDETHSLSTKQKE